MKYVFKHKDKVTAAEREQLQFLCYEDGLCWKKFQEKDGDVIICKDVAEIIGWAFIFDDGRQVKTFFVYIHSLYRRNGIGTEIYKQAKEKFGEMWYSRYDTRAKSFFYSCKSKYG